MIYEFGVFETDVDSISTAATLFGGVAAAAATAYKTAAEQMESLGRPWGDDEPGSAFWTAYGSAAENVLGNALQVGDQVAVLHENSRLTATSYTAVEHTNTQASAGVTA